MTATNDIKQLLLNVNMPVNEIAHTAAKGLDNNLLAVYTQQRKIQSALLALTLFNGTNGTPTSVMALEKQIEVASNTVKPSMEIEQRRFRK